MGSLCFGIDIGGTSIKMGLFTVEGELKENWEIVTRRDEGGKYVLDDIHEAVKKKMEERNLKHEDIEGIGLGVPGPVTNDGRVIICANLGWREFNVEEKLSTMSGFRVRAGNDANVAALGEMWRGGGEGCKDVVMVTLGTGVGGGIILNGDIITGSNGAAGEIGHMTVVYDHPEACGCGKSGGCLEQVASATGIVKEAQKLLNNSSKPSRLRELEYISAKAVFDEAKEGDELANELVENLGKYLGIALSHVSCIVDPQVFVIGGGVSRAGQILIDVIQKNHELNAFTAIKNKKFALAKLGNDAGIYGAARLVLNK